MRQDHCMGGYCRQPVAITIPDGTTLCMRDWSEHIERKYAEVVRR